MSFLFDRLLSWMTIEPFIWFLMILTAFVLFYQSYKSRETGPEDRFWRWSKRFLESLGKALLFLGILWACRSILNANYEDFRFGHGRVSEVNYKSVNEIWGGPHVQRDLVVTHTIERTKLEEIPREDPAAPPVYRKSIVREVVEQNSILDFNGNVNLVRNKRKKGSAYYNGFETGYVAKYHVINDSDEKTTALFVLPLSENQPIYEQFTVLENKKDIRSDLRYAETEVTWERQMTSGQALDIEVSYKTRGLDYFYFQIPTAREIKDFHLTITVDDLKLEEVNYPEGCLPPTGNAAATTDGKGVVLEWNLDKTITTAGMGIALPAPEQPGSPVASALSQTPVGLMWLVIAICLTFIILGKAVNFVELSLVCAGYIVEFVFMASLSDFALGFWGSLAIGAVLSLSLCFFLLVFGKKRTLITVCSYSLMGFFTVVYPMISLVEDLGTTLHGIMMVLLIVYVFILSLIRKKEIIKNGEA
jgi:hypothetical protein